MLDLFNLPTPQGCNIQTFYGTTVGTATRYTWVKPRGVSNIYMLLIGAGGNGNGSTGGGSGAVTVWYGSAQNVPDNLIAQPNNTTNPTTVRTKQAGSDLILLTANNASTITGGTASTAGVFAASGFYQSIAGMNGSASDIATPSSTTFLSGGGNSGVIVGNYGYRTGGSNESGFFQMQPIIVGTGSSGVSSIPLRGGIGCGGPAATPTGTGGPGFVLIASW